jgi:cobalamin biosynthesis Mg chelatase CobN
MKKELEDLRKEKKSLEEAKEREELERMRNEQAQKIESDISEALDAAGSILPKKNPLVLQRITQTMLMAMKKGYSNVTAKDVIPLVEKQWKQELGEFFNVLPEDTIEMLVGKENLDRLRKKRLQAKKASNTVTAKQLTQEASTATKREDEENKKKPIRMRDFFKD